MKTGWISGEDPGERPPMPVTEMMLDRQQRRAGPLETALARSRAADAREARALAASAADPDERAAGLLAADYRPGLLFKLQQQLSDLQAELESERAKIERGERRQERLARDHAAGRITALDIFRMQDFDEGDSYRCEQLERRAEGIRRQILEASQAISPPQQRDLDPVEQATRNAHEVFRELTLQRWAEAAAGAPPQRSRPPFESVSRGAGSTEHTGPDCQVCAKARKRDAARVAAAAAADDAAYAPGSVITTGYREVTR